MYQYTLGNEKITSNAGISYFAPLFKKNSEIKQFNNIKLENTKSGRISNDSIIKSMIILLSLQYSNFADIEHFKDNPLFINAIGGRIPSEATLRQRLNEIAEFDSSSIIDNITIKTLKNIKLGTRETVVGDLIPIDIDVSVLMNPYSLKEDVGLTYKKVNGYAPIFAYIGTEGYMLANELRPGKQHSEKGAIEFVKRCIKIAVSLGYPPQKLLLRLDSGHDDSKLLAVLQKEKVHYLIKRNPRREINEQVIDSIRSSAKIKKNRRGKYTYTEKTCNKMPPQMDNYKGFMAIEAVERTIDSKGQPLLIPTVEIASWWTSLLDDADYCVYLYHDHATSEQFHSELKSDMKIESLPSGKMKTNTLILALANIAFNFLRKIGQLSLKVKGGEKTVARIRLYTVIRDFMKVACKIVHHAHKIFLNFGCICQNFNVIKEIYKCCQKCS